MSMTNENVTRTYDEGLNARNIEQMLSDYEILCSQFGDEEPCVQKIA